jgi:hypothetical protein
MHNRSPLRGRRKAVERLFRVREGFWMLGIIGIIVMGIMLLLLFGYLDADMN